MNLNFDKIKPHLIAVGILLIIAAVYFSPQLSGKVLSQDDSNAFIGAVHENMEFEKKEHRTILWTNSMFGGMPMYQIHPSSDGNFVSQLNKPLRLFLGGPIGVFFAAFICMYLFILSTGANYKVAIIGAIAFGLTTNNIVLWHAGHATKVVALSYLALVLGGINLLFNKKYLWGSVLFTIGLALEIGANHIQMTYYFAMCLVVYWLVRSILLIKEGAMDKFLKVNGILVVCTTLAILTTAANYLPTYEYQKDTMRGDPILASTSDTIQSSSETKGLEWTYATNWSNGSVDLLASIIPNFVGGSSGGEFPDNSSTIKFAQQNQIQLNNSYMYWGDLGSTSGPAYFGAIVVFLMLFGAFILKGPLKWWLVGAIVFTTMLSMGRNLPGFYHLIFDNFPLFNKFRAPNSILGVTAFFVATLATLSLRELFLDKVNKEEIFKGLKIAGGITGGLCLLIAIMGPSLFDISWESDERLIEGYKQFGPGLVDAINEDRATLMTKDAWRSFIFIGLAFTSIWFFLKGKLNNNLFAIAIGLLILIDLWGVNTRYINKDSFQPKRTQENLFAMRPADQQIKMDPDLSYRVLDLSVNTFNSAIPSYHHQTIGGYSAAKLQRYQDIIDKHIQYNNMEVIDMLNTRYIINQEQNVQRNPNALGNAWFVQDIKKVNTPNEEIAAIDNKIGFRADSLAVVLDKEFNNYLGNFKPTAKNGTIELTKYVPDRLEYKSNTTSEQFAVFSEIWYGPNKGWKAYIDDKEVPFVRANYVLRGMKIPAGEHIIKFKFDPSSHKIGKTAATIASLIIFILLVFAIYKYVKKEDSHNLKTEGE